MATGAFNLRRWGYGDTYVVSSSEAKNYLEPELLVGSQAFTSTNIRWEMALFRFDVRQYLGKTISQATFWLYQLSGGGFGYPDYGLYAMLKRWRLKKITGSWFEYPRGYPEPLGDPIAVLWPQYGPMWHKWDITPLVRSWAAGLNNYGFLIMPVDASGLLRRSRYASLEYPDESLRPRLIVEVS